MTKRMSIALILLDMFCFFAFEDLFFYNRIYCLIPIECMEEKRNRPFLEIFRLYGMHDLNLELRLSDSIFIRMN